MQVADPDKASEAEREQAEAKFKQLTSAYALLSDPEKREKFDAGRLQPQLAILRGQYRGVEDFVH